MPEAIWLTQLSRESAEFARLHQELQESKTIGPSVRVAVCGLMNAGKSALLNGLTGHLETEFFETKAVRATKAVKMLTHEGITYIDTPGIDANEADDQQAWQGLANADIILFAHNLRTGTLETVEAAFLTELKRRRPNFQQHMLMVLTHAESATEQQQAREAAIKGILDTLLDAAPEPVSISFTALRTGTRNSKPALIQYSGFNELHQRLHTLVEHFNSNMQSIRSARDSERYNALDIIIEQAIDARKKRLEQIEAKQSDSFKKLRSSVKQLIKSTSERLTRCASA